MNQFDRILSLYNILRGRRTVITKVELAKELECSAKTVTDLMGKFKDELGAPIVYDRSLHGWKWDRNGDQSFELPGLWLSARELQSLILLVHLLENLGNGLLSEELVPVDERITRQLEQRGISRESLTQRIKVLPLASHATDEILLLRISRSLVQRHQVRIRYVDYEGNKTTREVSPQRMAYYRDNWYLDAWCHLRNALRVFALSRIEQADVMEENAIDCEETDLDKELASGYGIFAGAETQMARLAFDEPVAREVASSRWHPRQKGEWVGESYELEFPYSDDRELIRDILRYVPNVRVLGPEELRRRVGERLREAIVQYE